MDVRNSRSLMPRYKAMSAGLIRQVSHLYHTSDIARAAVEEIVRTHQMGADLYTTTLSSAEAMVQEAEQHGPLTPLQQAALDHYQQAYQYELLAIIEAHGDEVLDLVARLLNHSGEHNGTG